MLEARPSFPILLNTLTTREASLFAQFLSSYAFSFFLSLIFPPVLQSPPILTGRRSVPRLSTSFVYRDVPLLLFAPP